MKHLSQTYLKTFAKVLAIALALLIAGAAAAQWDPPVPPSAANNVPAPINVGSNAQLKSGPLLLGNGMSAPSDTTSLLTLSWSDPSRARMQFTNFNTGYGTDDGLAIGVYGNGGAFIASDSFIDLNAGVPGAGAINIIPGDSLCLGGVCHDTWPSGGMVGRVFGGGYSTYNGGICNGTGNLGRKNPFTAGGCSCPAYAPFSRQLTGAVTTPTPDVYIEIRYCTD